MNDNLSVPVIAALVVGVVLILMLSALATSPSRKPFSPVSHLGVDNTIIASANRLKETQVFFSEYPNGKAQVDRSDNEIEGQAVKYSYEKVYADGNVNEVRMFVMIGDSNSKTTGQIYVDCAVSSLGGFGAITYSSLAPDITQQLHETKCAK
jgi:hypothetical protein